MAYCKFTHSAERDLEEIIDYTLDKWGKSQTIKYINDLNQCTILISRNPDIGINRKEILENIFSFPFKEHIIYYIKQQGGIVIIRVLHKHTCPTLHKFPKD